MPITGTLMQMWTVSGTYQSVGVDGMRSGNWAIYNARTVMEFNATAPLGRMAYVAVGATCVGSVVILGNATEGNVPGQSTASVGTTFTKGENLGYFQFGGSTIVLVFPPGAVTWSEDILFHSGQAVEALVNMGSVLGRATGF